MKKAPLFFLIVVFALGMFTGCGKTATTKVSGFQNQPLKIGVLMIEDNLPFFLAEAEKRFENAGLSVDLIPFPSAAERDAALQARQIDGEAADIVAASLLKKGGTDVRISTITLGVTPQEGRFVLLGAPNSNFKSANELAGVKIAISENTIIEYITDTLLTKEGLKKDQIQKLSIPKMPIRLQMLVNNQVQAALLPDPLASLAEKQGAKVILDDTKSEANISQVVLLFRKESIDTKREAIKKLIEVYGLAGKDLTENPSKYRLLLIEKAKIPAPVKDTYKSPSFSSPQAPTEQEVSNVINWMVEKKLLQSPYNYNEMVDKTLLQ
ncbi:MAG: MetQ/NlpA family ABC transporter substrate-binding protein [Eubacteriales bacterium]